MNRTGLIRSSSLLASGLQNQLRLRNIRVHSMQNNYFQRMPKNVAIIGGGASGLVCAKECLNEGHRVTIFEQSTAVGGTWITDQLHPTMQTMDVLSKEAQKKAVRVHSSMYDNLRTNLPREIMGYTYFPFDTHFPGSKDPRRYPEHQEVRRYLEAFAEEFHLHDVTEFSTTVKSVHKVDGSETEWNIEILSEGGTEVRVFDAVVVANGHYSTPHIPPIKNIDLFQKPCLHSHLYRNPTPFLNKNVAILGNKNSGSDLAQDIAQVATDVYLCGRTWIPEIKRLARIGNRKNIHLRSAIDQCLGQGRLQLTDGSILEDIDVLLFCTGYLFDFPFLTDTNLVDTSQRIVYPLYLDIFHTQHSSLSFVGICYRVVPFIIAEYQSKLIARVLSGRCQLPRRDVMTAEVDNTIAAYRKNHASME